MSQLMSSSTAAAADAGGEVVVPAEQVRAFRIHVSNFSQEVGSDDLAKLFGKLCTVSEVYIPGPTITGLRRNFAVITVVADEPSAKKCIKAFNGSSWKGSKIYCEFSRQQYFRTRLEDEKQEEVANLYEATQIAKTFEPAPFPVLESVSLKIKNKTFLLDNIHVSLLPKSVQLPSGESVKHKHKNKAVVPCGKKIVFPEYVEISEDEIIGGPLHIANASKIKGREKKSKNKTQGGEVANANMDNCDDSTSSSSSETESSDSDGSDSDSDADNNVERSAMMIKHRIVSPVHDSSNVVESETNGQKEHLPKKSEPVRLVGGGGVRRGFGSVTLASDQAVKLKASVSTECTDTSADCCKDGIVAELKATRVGSIWEVDEDLAERVPCVAVEDVTEEALARERKRALTMFENFYSSEALPKAVETYTAPVSVVEIKTNLEKAKAKLVQKKEERLAIKKAKEEQHKREAEEEAVVWDPEMDFDLDLEPPPKAHPLASTTSTASAEKLAPASKEQSKAAAQINNSEAEPTSSATAAYTLPPPVSSFSFGFNTSDPSDEHNAMTGADNKKKSKDVVEVKAGALNMGKLRGIFEKDDGQWWGGDGTDIAAVVDAAALTVKEATKGKVNATGKVFAATVPTSSSSSSASSSTTTTTDGAARASITGQEKGNGKEDFREMKFAFFQETSTNSTDAIIIAAANNKNTTLTSSLDGSEPALMSSSVIPSSSSLASFAEPTVAKIHPVVENAPPAAPNMAITPEEIAIQQQQRLLASVINAANSNSAQITLGDFARLSQSFCRKRPVEELKQDWKAGRDKLVTDYKRKHKDAKKSLSAAGSAGRIFSAAGGASDFAAAGRSSHGHDGGGGVASGGGGGGGNRKRDFGRRGGKKGGKK